jgi:hypothetical protein
MAGSPSTRTQRLPREELAEFLPNHRAIKAFENLVADVTQTLPQAIASTTEDAGSVVAMEMFRHRMPDRLPQFDDDAGRLIAIQVFGA